MASREALGTELRLQGLVGRGTGTEGRSQELEVSLRGTRSLMAKFPSKLIVGFVGVGIGARRQFIDTLECQGEPVVEIRRPEDAPKSN